MPQDWSSEQAARIATEVRRLRGSRSAQWLSNRTTELGYTVTRSLIADLENGRRKYLTTAELIVLAEALDTAPIALLYPPPYNDQVEALPNLDVPKIDAVQRFSGIFYRPGDVPSREYAENMWPLIKARELKELESRSRSLVNLIDSLQKEGRPPESLMNELEHVTKRIESLEAADYGR